MLKQAIFKFLSDHGYSLTKTKIDWESDKALYEQYFPKESIDQRRFYNVGAGRFSHPFWTNLDKVSEHYKDRLSPGNLDIDLFEKKPLPIDDGTAEVFYCSHVLEHIDTASAQLLLNQMYQKLRSGGVVRLTMPDIDLAYQAYIKNDKSYFIWLKKWGAQYPDPRLNFTKNPLNCDIGQIFLSHVAHHAAEIHPNRVDDYITSENLRNLFADHDYEDALDLICSKCSIEHQMNNPSQHINWYNFRKCERMLTLAGFTGIRKSGYQQSLVPIMRNSLFDTSLPPISLYIEAYKN
jgi:predicted SAM-dependent methyltransferase